MKKILLLIVPLLLLFGVSFGETFVFDTYTPGTTLSQRGNSTVFSIFGTSGNTINLYSIAQGNFTGVNCTLYWLQKLNSDGTFILLTSGTLNSITGTTIINKNLEPGNYIVTVGNIGSSCIFPQQAVSSYGYSSGFFYVANNYYSNANPPTTNFPFINITKNGGISNFTFSGTDPRTLSPTTIRYNGISTGFVGSNIYLSNLFYEPTFSGSDIVFRPRIYRALFRSH